MQVQTTLTGHEAKSGTSQYGTWTLHFFTASDGSKYQTNKSPIANAVFGLAFNQDGTSKGVPVVLDFEVEQKGQYTNNVIKGVSTAGGVASIPGVALGTAVQPVPGSTVNPVVAPTHTGKPTDEALRIGRAVAMQEIPAWHNAGIIQVTRENAAQTIDYFGRLIALGRNETGAGAPGAASSGGVGAAQAGVGSPAPAAPVATVGEAVAQALPDDGIPY